MTGIKAIPKYKNITEYVIKRVESFKGQTAQIGSKGEILEYDEIPLKLARAVGFLQQSGVKKGDVICICNKNTIDYCVWLLGIFHVGGVGALISPGVKQRELKHALNTFKPKWFIGEDLNAGQRSVFDEHAQVKRLQFCLTEGKPGVKLGKPSEHLDDDTALILMSSGSTGLPKGVLISHMNVIEALIHSAHLFHKGAKALGLMPFFHAFGLVLMLLALCEGTELIIMERFNPDALFSIIDQHKLTHLHLVPSLLPVFIKNGEQIRDKIKSLRHIWTGAGLINPTYQKAIVNLIPGVEAHHTYGMTETTFIVFNGSYRVNKPSSVGKLLPIFDCKIVNSQGDTCQQGEKGELCYKGPTVTKGYLNNEKATKETIDEDGWLHSGDLGFVDEDGYYYVVDRIKELIKYQGNQVSPSELETVILTHKGVLDVGVIGLPHETYGEVPMAFVVRESLKVSEEEILKLVEEELSSHKQLRGGVCFVDAIPRTGNGKIYRRELRERVNQLNNINEP